MISVDEDALVCDLAETYGIFEMREVPVHTLAVLADGLKPESRIKNEITGREMGIDDLDVNVDTILLANLCDLLSLLIWGFSTDAQEGKNMPVSMVDVLLHRETHATNNNDLETYETPDDFMTAWKQKGGGT